MTPRYLHLLLHVYADLIEKLNSDLNQISKWLAINKLQHHPTNGNDHWIGTKSKRNSPVMLNGKTIPSTDSFECLGVIIDKRLLWDKHIEKICKKVGAGIAVMKRIKPFVPIETMRLIYNALIQPYKSRG